MKNSLNHLAIIMDGNNRWAKRNSVSLITAYEKGAEAADNVIVECINLKIKYLTIFAFSIENWNRPKKEIDFLMAILENYLTSKILKIIENDVRVIFIGERELMNEKIQLLMKKAEDDSKDCKKLFLTIALSYGSQQEIISAAFGASKKNTSKELFEDEFKNIINPYNIPAPDLLIRTSGERRLSNFLLWQLAYTELYFIDVLWPDFDKNELHEALKDFDKRVRRYGKR